MTCAQGLLRLLWGGPEVGVLRDCVAQMLVVLTHKKMSCLVVGMFDDLVGPLSY